MAAAGCSGRHMLMAEACACLLVLRRVAAACTDRHMCRLAAVRAGMGCIPVHFPDLGPDSQHGCARAVMLCQRTVSAAVLCRHAAV
jgi:hypothetical protein